MRPRARVDFLLVAVALAFLSGPSLALAFIVTVSIHELGHCGTAMGLVGFRGPLFLQLNGGGAYVREAGHPRRAALVLLAGSFASLLLVTFAWLMVPNLSDPLLRRFAADIVFVGVIWSVFQLFPLPPMDGGQLVRVLTHGRVKSALSVWRVQWIVGLALVVLVIAWDLRALEPGVWLAGMAIILGRSEAGYVRHLDAFSAWERGDFRGVLARTRKIPIYLDQRDRVPLLELGLAASFELDEVAAVEELSSRIEPHREKAIEAATWLLRKERSYGARLAQRALDALDAEVVKDSEIDHERWADMAFGFAVFEAMELRFDSAFGLLERAMGLGFDNIDRLEAEGRFAPMKPDPRWQAMIQMFGLQR